MLLIRPKSHHLISSAINRYLRSKDSLAMQIDGPWGTGKTYYITHTVFNKMRNGEYNKEYVPVYVSLNGVKNIYDLKRKLSIALISSATGNRHKRDLFITLTLFSSGLEGFFRSNKYLSILNRISVNPKKILKNLEDNLLKNNNIVFIFDDLERSVLHLNVIFGFLSNVIYEFGCKTLIISNQKKCHKRDRKFLKKYKEKIIDKTIYFGRDSKQIAYYDILEKDIPQDYDYRGWILNISWKLLSDLKIINLRTLLNIINNYKILYNSLLLIKDKYRNQKHLWDKSLKVGYLSIFTLSDVIRNNKIREINDNDIDKIFNHTALSLKRLVNNKNIFKKNYLYKIFFVKSDKDFFNNILYTSDIYNLVVSDIFSVTNFIKKVKIAFYSSTAIIHKEFDILFYNNHFYSLSDNNIKMHTMKLCNALDGVGYQNINFNYLINIYNNLYKLNNLGLFFKSLGSSGYINKLHGIIIHIAWHMPISKINALSQITVSERNNRLRRELNYIYNKKSTEIPLYKEKSYVKNILSSGKSGINEDSIIRNKSVLSIILSDSCLKQLIINNEDPKPLVNLMNYLDKKIINNKDCYKYHRKELLNISSFLTFLHKRSKGINSHIVKVDIKLLIRKLNKCRTCLKISKKNIIY